MRSVRSPRIDDTIGMIGKNPVVDELHAERTVNHIANSFSGVTWLARASFRNSVGSFCPSRTFLATFRSSRVTRKYTRNHALNDHRTHKVVTPFLSIA